MILVGHTRRLAAIALEQTHVPVHVAAGLTPDQARAYRLADNGVGEETEWDLEGLAAELDALRGGGFDMLVFGFDEDELSEALSCGLALDGVRGGPSLMERFGVVPFTALNAREGWWQDEDDGH